MILNNPTKRYCFPDGSKDSRIALVGEAPGVEEERHGKGFIGASGQLLFRLAASAGITRADCYCTNVIKERAIIAKMGKVKVGYVDFITFYKGNVTITQAYKDYEQYLYDELKTVKANIIVTVGRVSLYALTRLQQHYKRRGSILIGLDNIDNRKIIPIIDPEDTKQQYLLSQCISSDFRRIAEESKFPEIRTPIRNIYIRPTYMDVLAFLQKCSELPEIAFDIEVMREEVSCISFAQSSSEVMSIPFQIGSDNYFSPEQEMIIWRKIGSILGNPDISKIGQNLVFDSTFLFQRFGIVTRNMEDTMIAHKLMLPDLPMGLDYITSTYTKEPYYKDEGKKWFKLGGSQDDFWIYNAKDSAVCIEAIPRIKADLEMANNIDVYNHQKLLIGPLTYMQHRGIKMNSKAMKEASIQTGVEIAELAKQLKELTGYDINPASSKQVQAYFYDVKGEKPYINRATHKPSADKDAIKRLSRKGYEEARILQKISQLSYNKSHYLDVTLDKDNRLRCSFNPVGTKYGRLSSSETIFDTGTNMQNLPDEFRKYLLADDDNLIFNIDLSQAENRIVAYIAPEPNMIAAFENKVDVHSLTATFFAEGLSLEEIKKQDDDDVKCSLGGGLYTWRFWGKKANHGLNYDLGWNSFGMLYEISAADAKYIVNRYHTAYPGVRQYHAWVKNILGKSRTLENAFGRKYLFLDRWGDDLFKNAYAFFPQSTTADIINRRGLNHIFYNQQWYKPVDLLLQIHDNIIFQMNYKKYSWEQQAECLIRIKESLEQPLTWRGTSFSIPADTAIGYNLHKKEMVKIKHDDFSSVAQLARRLSDTYGSLRASLYI